MRAVTTELPAKRVERAKGPAQCQELNRNLQCSIVLEFLDDFLKLDVEKGHKQTGG